MKIGFIGCGKMGSAIIAGLQAQGHKDLMISEVNAQISQDMAEQLGTDFAQSHQDLLDQVDFVILAIKPQFFESALAGLNFKQPVMSIAAGVSLERLGQLTDPKLALIRIMPNLNAQIQQSSTAICFNEQVTPDVKDLAKEITDSFGQTYELAEKDFDTFTALAGSSPAYIALFMEALAKAGVKYGLPKELALSIVQQTVTATSQNLQTSGLSPHTFIDQVSSPGGTTIAGFLDLEKTGFSASVVSSIDATIARAKEL